MNSSDVEETLNLAIAKSDLTHIKVKHRLRLLTDNGSAFISDAFNIYKMDHVRGAPYLPSTNTR